MAYGDGSFTKYGKGYRYSVYYKSDVDGKTYRLTVTGAKKGECRDKMDAKMGELIKKQKAEIRHSVENRTAAFQHAILNWLKREKMGKVKASTYDRNERTIFNHLYDTDLGFTRTLDVTSKDIQTFLDELLAENSESTTVKVYDLFNQFFRFFYAEDINANPMNKIDRPRKRNVGEVSIDDVADEHLEDIVLSDEEIKVFKNQCFLPHKNGVKGRPKHGPALYLMLVTVVRCGEATALVWGDIDEERRVMTVRRNQSIVKSRDDTTAKTKRIMTTPKSGRSREVMLSAEALEALAEIKKRSHHTDKTDLVICSDSGKSLTNHNLRKALDSVMSAAKLDSGSRKEKFGLHYLRHTGISYYIRHGIPLEMVSKMAGHSSVAITERVYYHIIHQQQEKMLELMDGI